MRWLILLGLLGFSACDADPCDGPWLGEHVGDLSGDDLTGSLAYLVLTTPALASAYVADSDACTVTGEVELSLGEIGCEDAEGDTIEADCDGMAALSGALSPGDDAPFSGELVGSITCTCDGRDAAEFELEDARLGGEPEWGGQWQLTLPEMDASFEGDWDAW